MLSTAMGASKMLLIELFNAERAVSERWRTSDATGSTIQQLSRLA